MFSPKAAVGDVGPELAVQVVEHFFRNKRNVPRVWHDLAVAAPPHRPGVVIALDAVLPHDHLGLRVLRDAAFLAQADSDDGAGPIR